MPTTIRLQRVGRKKQASFRIVVTDKAIANNAPALETLGTYNPRTQPSLIKLNAVSALRWLHEGATPSDTVVSIFKKTGVWEKFHAGVAADAIEAEDAIIQLGFDRKTSRRAELAAEGQKQAEQRRAEEKAAAEAAARKAAEEKAAAEKAAAEKAAAEEAEAEAAAEEAEAEEVEAEAEDAEAEDAEDEAEAADADEAEADEAPEAEADEEPKAEAGGDAEEAAGADDEAEADDDAEKDEEE